MVATNHRRPDRVRGQNLGRISLLVALLVLLPPGSSPGAEPQHSETDTNPAYETALEKGLFGRFEAQAEQVVGDFVQFDMDPMHRGLHALRFNGTLVLERFDPGIPSPEPHLDGPAFIADNETTFFAVHDNRYAWLAYEGPIHNASMRFPSGSTVAAVSNGVRIMTGEETLWLTYGPPHSPFIELNGSTIHIETETGTIGFLLYRDRGLGVTRNLDGWLLVAHDPPGTVVDRHWIASAPPEVRGIAPDVLEIELPERHPDEVDGAYRIEVVGVFPDDAAARFYVEGPDGSPFSRRPVGEVFRANGTERWFNATADPENESAILLLRQPAQTHGAFRIIHDPVPPGILSVSVHDLTPEWRLPGAAPRLVVETDEGTTGQLVLTPASGAPVVLGHTETATRLVFPLEGLDPQTPYDWMLTVTDRAGNTNRTRDALVTPPDPMDLQPEITIHTPEPGAVYAPGVAVWLNLTVHDGMGRPLPSDRILVHLDGRALAIDHPNETHQSIHLGLLEDGPHTLRTTAIGHAPKNVAIDEVEFTVAIDARLPGPAMLPVLTAAMLLLAIRRWAQAPI